MKKLDNRIAFHALVDKDLKLKFDVALATMNLEATNNGGKVCKKWEAVESLMENFIVKILGEGELNNCYGQCSNKPVTIA